MNARVRITKGSDNVFRDLGFTESNAQNLLVASEFMLARPGRAVASDCHKLSQI